LERSRAPRMLRAVTSLGRLGLGLFFLSASYLSWSVGLGPLLSFGLLQITC
jgi:hypothetical protein